jgi:hypothetical protein
MPITIYHDEDGTIIGLSAAPADAAPIEVVADEGDDASGTVRSCIRSIRIEAPAGSGIQFDSRERLGVAFEDFVRDHCVDRGKLARK